MGDELALPATAPATVRVRAEAISISPLDSLQIIVNGKTVKNVIASDSLRIVFDEQVAIPEGGWIAVRVLGPSHRYVTDSYAFAQSTPVYVVRGGRKFVVAEDGRFLADVVSAIWTRAERSRWRTPAERERFKAAVDQAKAVYEQCARG